MEYRMIKIMAIIVMIVTIGVIGFGSKYFDEKIRMSRSATVLKAVYEGQ